MAPERSSKTAGFVITVCLVVVAVVGGGLFALRSYLRAPGESSESSSVLSGPSSAPTFQTAVHTVTSGPAPVLPKILPGMHCDDPSKLFGKPVEQDEYGRVWDQNDFTLSVVTDNKCHITGVSVWVDQGQRATTPDNIVLGKTTLAETEKLLGPRFNPDNRALVILDGSVEATVAIDPTPEFPYHIIYRALLAPGTGPKDDRDSKWEDFEPQKVTEYSVDMVSPKGNKR